MKCESDCQWTYTGADGKPWHCECGAVDMALQLAAAEAQVAEGRTAVAPRCDTDCPNAQEGMRIIFDAAILLRSLAEPDTKPTAAAWAALADLERRAKAITPCPHCHPQPPPAPKAQ